ncbi:MAG: DUF4163 domain-containing protein [Candidatus Paceibacterota bacterium]
MRKNKKFIVIFVIILVLATALYIINKNSKLVEAPTVVNNPKDNSLVMAGSFETKTIPLDEVYTKFDVKYPSFKNADKNFNLQIENLLKTEIQSFKTDSAANWQARFDTQAAGENIKKVPANADKFTFASDFVIVQSNANYISFVLHYGGFNGGAHGFENVISYNYNVKSQKKVELGSLFSKGSNYLNTLSTKSRAYLKNKFAIVTEEDKKNSDPVALKEYIDNATSMINDGTESKIENFSVFTFTPDKIKIYFADYQVGPHAIGMPEFEFDR